MSGLISNTNQKQAACNTSKTAVIMPAKSLVSEWSKYNVRVNTIAPG